jgi:hypothetical protein
LAAVPLLRAAHGRLVLAADLTCWLRPPHRNGSCATPTGGARTSTSRRLAILGDLALETGRSSWTAPLDALRLAPGEDAVTVTAGQMPDLVERLITAGQ